MKNLNFPEAPGAGQEASKFRAPVKEAAPKTPAKANENKKALLNTIYIAGALREFNCTRQEEAEIRKRLDEKYHRRKTHLPYKQTRDVVLEVVAERSSQLN